MELTIIGGGQSIGDSAYLLKVGGHRILLDAGSGLCDESFRPLFEQIGSFSALDAIVISHAHRDHVGYLPKLTTLCDAPVYTSEITLRLAATAGLIDGIEKSRFRPVAEEWIYNPAEGLRLLFSHAGHIPGALMTLIESRYGRVLYTGDFNPIATPLTPCCRLLPEFQGIDLLIMSGTHACAPEYRAVDPFVWAGKVAELFTREGGLFIPVNQLTKGLEIVCLLTKLQNEQSFPQIDLYLDSMTYDLAKALGGVLSKNCRRLTPGLSQQGVYIGKPVFGSETYTFTICTHVVYAGCQQILDALRPKAAVVVHTPQHYSDFYHTLNCPSGPVFYPESGETLHF